MLTAQVSLYAERYPWLRAIVLVLSSGLLFGIGLRLSINTFLRHDLIVCWPLVGLQIATLLRMPRRDWPPVVAGMAIGQILFERSEPFDEIINDTLCDLAELLIGAYCLPALNGVSEWIKQPRLLQRFVIWPMVLGPALTGLPAAAVYSHELHVSYWSYWVRWFTGDMLGVVLWLPLGAILMSSEICVLFTWKALPRTMVLLGTLSLAGWCIFNARPTPVGVHSHATASAHRFEARLQRVSDCRKHSVRDLGSRNTASHRPVWPDTGAVQRHDLAGLSRDVHAHVLPDQHPAA